MIQLWRNPKVKPADSFLDIISTSWPTYLGLSRIQPRINASSQDKPVGPGSDYQGRNVLILIQLSKPQKVPPRPASQISNINSRIHAKAISLREPELWIYGGRAALQASTHNKCNISFGPDRQGGVFWAINWAVRLQNHGENKALVPNLGDVSSRHRRNGPNNARGCVPRSGTAAVRGFVADLGGARTVGLVAQAPKARRITQIRIGTAFYKALRQHPPLTYSRPSCASSQERVPTCTSPPTVKFFVGPHERHGFVTLWNSFLGETNYWICPHAAGKYLQVHNSGKPCGLVLSAPGLGAEKFQNPTSAPLEFISPSVVLRASMHPTNTSPRNLFPRLGRRVQRKTLVKRFRRHCHIEAVGSAPNCFSTDEI
ncbi:hypothetical protein DFH06DRAFT_1300436 [Mycena polygramma]|nr:hypothetical protein DFH06DRAFT_1300436 [Mycena polygramma]